MHAVLPTESWYMPGMQLLQVVERGAAGVAEYVPAAQAMQFVEPVAIWYLPAAQLRQFTAPIWI